MACSFSSTRAKARCRRRVSSCGRRWRARLPVVLVVNKIDRPDARAEEVVNEVYDLFLDLGADESQIEFPIVYCVARSGKAALGPDALADDLEPLFETLLATVPAPSYDPEHPLQALVTNLDASPYVGRLALCRVRHGVLRKGAAGRLVPRRRHDRERTHHGAVLDRSTRPRARPTRRGRARSSPSPVCRRSRSARLSPI